jgi:hypothetical protein
MIRSLRDGRKPILAGRLAPPVWEPLPELNDLDAFVLPSENSTAIIMNDLDDS